MFHAKKNNARKSRRGSVVTLVAISLTLVVGIVAIAIDGGLLQDNKRRLQNAADGAAIAGANKLYSVFPTLSATSFDPGGKAVAAAKANASANGFPNNGTDTVVDVRIPPTTGPFTGKLGYVEVVITYQQPRYFSTIWGSTTTPIVARAVSKAYYGGSGDGVIVLDPTAKDSFDSSGGGGIVVSGGAAVIVDSNNPEAARTTGGGAATAPLFAVTGGTTGTFNGDVQTGAPPIPDPLAYLPAPTMPQDGTMTTTSIGNGNKQYVLTPGRFTKMPSLQVGDVMIFKQASANGNGGIYYIDGGGFSSQGGTLTMDPLTTGGIMIYNAPSGNAQNQGINITGNAAGVVNLGALTSGPYAGILFWQERTAAQTLSITGQGSFTLTGTFYCANALMTVTGNGNCTIGSQYISRTVSISGTGVVTIDYTANGTARTRDVRLVE